VDEVYKVLADYLLLDADKEYRKDFVEYCNYMLTHGFKELEGEILNVFSISKLPKLSNDDIVQGAIFKSIKERDKKLKNKNFYICNAVCLLNTLKKIITNDFIENLKKNNNNELLKYNYISIVKECLLDYGDLCKTFQHQAPISRSQQTMTMYQTFRQMLYGQYSFHSFTDKEINMSINLIRQMIELRIRKAFGIMAIENKDGGIEPIAVSTIFESINPYHSSITYEVPLANIMRIYSWANIYVHSGVKSYAWIPMMLEEYLRPLLLGVEDTNRNWSVNNGISLSQETLGSIKNDILNKIGKDKKIIECRPEVLII